MNGAELQRLAAEVAQTLPASELKHPFGPDWDVFTVRDKALLANLKPGDKVKFSVVHEGGKMVVTDIQPAS